MQWFVFLFGYFNGPKGYVLCFYAFLTKITPLSITNEEVAIPFAPSILDKYYLNMEIHI